MPFGALWSQDICFYYQHSAGVKGRCPVLALRSSLMSLSENIVTLFPSTGRKYHFPALLFFFFSPQKSFFICFCEMFVSGQCLDSMSVCVRCSPAYGWLCYSWFPGCRQTSNSAVSSWCLSPQPISQSVLPINFQTAPFSVPSCLLQGLERHWSMKQ